MALQPEWIRVVKADHHPCPARVLEALLVPNAQTIALGGLPKFHGC